MGVGLFVTATTAACGASQATVHHQSSASILMSSVVLPPGAQPVATPGGSLLASLPSEPCRPSTSVVRYWTAPGSASAGTTYLMSHPVHGLVVSPPVTGYLHGRPRYSALNEGFQGQNPSANSFIYRYLSTGNGRVEVRVDASTVPSGSDCVSRP
jgi:hypothetical protein